MPSWWRPGMRPYHPFRTVIPLFLSSVNIIFLFARIFLYITGYIHFTLLPYIYGTGLKVKWFLYNTANSENRV